MAYYNAQSLRNWLLSNDWVTETELSVEPKSVVFYTMPVSAGDVILYKWKGNRSNELDTHTAIVTSTIGGIHVADQGSGDANSSRLWNVSGSAGHVGAPQVELEPEMKAYLLHWK